MPKKVKISVIGIGLMGLQHIKAIQRSKNTSLHSIVEIKKDGIKLSKKFNVPLYKNIKILLAKNKRIYSPIKGFYKGITFRSLEKKLPKIHKRNIFVNQLQEFDEIILIGSGKGVVSVSKIYENNWKRKSSNYFKLISKIFNSEIKKCKKITI